MNVALKKVLIFIFSIQAQGVLDAFHVYSSVGWFASVVEERAEAGAGEGAGGGKTTPGAGVGTVGNSGLVEWRVHHGDGDGQSDVGGSGGDADLYGGDCQSFGDGSDRRVVLEHVGCRDDAGGSRDDHADRV